MTQKYSSFRQAGTCLNRNLAYSYPRLNQQQRLLEQVRRHLPDSLASHVKHCLIANAKLVIYTDSAVWASQLRFYAKNLQIELSQLYQTQIINVQIKILTIATGVPKAGLTKAKLPGRDTIAAIRDHSLAIQDTDLRQALLRLATRLEQLSGVTTR